MKLFWGRYHEIDTKETDTCDCGLFAVYGGADRSYFHD